MPTPSETHEAVFGSFFHSQGDLMNQVHIYHWLDRAGIVSFDDALGYTMDDENLSKFFRFAVNSSSHMDASKGSLEVFLSDLREELTYPVDRLVPDLAHGIASQDEKYSYVILDERPDRPAYQGRRNPSHFALFGLLGLPTGKDYFDKMYAEITDWALNGYEPVHDNFAGFFGRAVSAHIQRNPDDFPAIARSLQFDEDTFTNAALRVHVDHRMPAPASASSIR